MSKKEAMALAEESGKSVTDDFLPKEYPLSEARYEIERLKNEIKEKEAEKAHYLKENDFLKEALRRIIGS